MMGGVIAIDIIIDCYYKGLALLYMKTGILIMMGYVFYEFT